MYVLTLVLDLFKNSNVLSLLSICAEEPKIIAFWPNSPLGNEKRDFLSNPIPVPEYPYLSIPVKVTAENKQFFSAGSSEWELESPSS